MINNNTKKNKAYNSAVIKSLSEKYNVDSSLVYRALKSERSSITALQIKKDYNKLNALIRPIVTLHQQEIEKIIEDFIKAENAS